MMEQSQRPWAWCRLLDCMCPFLVSETNQPLCDFFSSTVKYRKEQSLKYTPRDVDPRATTVLGRIWQLAKEDPVTLSGGIIFLLLSSLLDTAIPNYSGRALAFIVQQNTHDKADQSDRGPQWTNVFFPQDFRCACAQ